VIDAPAPQKVVLRSIAASPTPPAAMWTRIRSFSRTYPKPDVSSHAVAYATGSAAARTKSSDAGIRRTSNAGVHTRSAWPPKRQIAHTRSPRVNPETPGPSVSIVPATS
jgi:hypothetical protein